MKPLAVLLLILTTVLTLPLMAHAQSKPSVRPPAAGSTLRTRPAAALMYACSICHHQVTAAQAKKLHYVCPVDHGKLVPVKAALPSKAK